MNRTIHPDSSVQTVLRLCIAGAALLFLLSALLGSFPDATVILRSADENALAGYEKVSLTTPVRPPILEEYYDRFPQAELTAPVPQTQ